MRQSAATAWSWIANEHGNDFTRSYLKLPGSLSNPRGPCVPSTHPSEEQPCSLDLAAGSWQGHEPSRRIWVAQRVPGSSSLYWKEHSRNPQLCHEPLRERREPKRRLPFAVWKVTCSCVGHSFLTVGFLSQFCGQATVTCSLAATGTAWGWVPEPVCLDSYPSSTTSGKFLPFSVPRSLQLKSRGNDSTHFLESLSRLS